MYSIMASILPTAVCDIIAEFIFDNNAEIRKWKAKFCTTVLELDKGYHMVSIKSNGNYCMYCYIEAMKQQTMYVDLCPECNTSPSVVIDFETFKKCQMVLNNKRLSILSKFNYKILRNILNDSKCLQRRYEISRGPLIWTQKERKSKILLNRFHKGIKFSF